MPAFLCPLSCARFPVPAFWVLGIGYWVLGVCLLIILVACQAGNGPGPSEPGSEPAIEAEANREGVSIVRDEQREVLPVEEQISLKVGESVMVDEGGRAVLNFSDLLTAELFQAGEIVLQEFSVDEQSATITVWQNGGTLLLDFNPDQKQDRRLTIQTDFATITTTGARFVVVQEIDSPLEWIVNLGSAKDEVQVTTAAETQLILGGAARWVAPDNISGQGISVDAKRLQAWLDGTRSGTFQLALGEVLFSPANMILDTDSLPALPKLGQPFELERTGQGAVKLTLDPIGLFGNPTYALEDCNGDGRRDIAIQRGKIQFDFRSLLARVLALDVTVLNRDQPDYGALSALDPAGEEIDRDLLAVGAGESQTLSLRSDQPYHYAELVMSNGCFMGFSLTPPGSSGEPSQPRAAATAQPDEVVVNILAEPDQSRSETDQMEALPVSTESYTGTIQIDGELDDWNGLPRSSGLDWTNFDTITYDKACTQRYPDSGPVTDLGGRVRFAYDERYLYVAFQVEDDGYVGYTGTDQAYFLGDSPQLSLDMDLLGDYDKASLSQDDWQVDFLPDFESPRVALWQLGSLTARPFDEALVAAAPTATGYFLEAALPWSGLSASPQPGTRLGLAANINDNDTPETNVQECIISTAPQREWNDPTTWGTLLLKPAD